MLRNRWREVSAIGLVSFAVPFLGCTAIARWGLGWSPEASWLAGFAMSTTSVAVVYAVILEFGLNVNDYGKGVLAACLLGMVLAGTVGKNHALVRRLRTLTFGLPTPFYFIPSAFFLPRHLLPEGEKS